MTTTSTSVNPTNQPNATTSTMTNQPLTRTEIDTENTSRTSRNQALQARRDAGETGVPADETLLQRPSTPTGQGSGQPSQSQQWIAAFALMSPGSQAQAAQAFEIVNPITAPTPSIPTLPNPHFLFSADQEIVVSTVFDSTYGLATHPTILDLVGAKQHIPLTLFTNEATKRLHREGHTLKKIKSTVNGSIFYLLDLSLFPAEDSMDAFTWHEAWKRYLTWLEIAAEPKVFDRWTWHYTTLSKDEDVRSNFRAILLFDIDMRSSYATQPFTNVPANWQMQLQARLTSQSLSLLPHNTYLFSQFSPQSTKNKVIRDQLNELLLASNHSSSSSHRYEPYNNSQRNARRSQDHHDAPSFRNATHISDRNAAHTSDRNTFNAPDRPRSDPTCLICHRSGHRYSDCKEETTAKGKPTFAKYTGGSLVRRSNGTPLCVAFNLNNAKRPCKNTHASAQHACSFCGDSLHGALARLCI